MSKNSVRKLVREVARLSMRVVRVIVNNHPSISMKHGSGRKTIPIYLAEIMDCIRDIRGKGGHRHDRNGEVLSQRPRAQWVAVLKSEFRTIFACVRVGFGFEASAEPSLQRFTFLSLSYVVLITDSIAAAASGLNCLSALR